MLEIRELKDGKYEFFMDEPIEPMEWSGAIIEPMESGYVFTLYWGYTSREGRKKSFKLPGLAYPEFWAPTVEECVKMAEDAFADPTKPLLVSIEQALKEK